MYNQRKYRINIMIHYILTGSDDVDEWNPLQQRTPVEIT